MADFDENRIEPGTKFFMTLFVGSRDGTINLCSETPAGFERVEDALDGAIDDVESFGGEVYVFQVVPVRLVRRLENLTDIEITTIDR